jgi:hypothetical protein
MLSGLQTNLRSRQYFGSFLLLQKPHSRHPWRSRHDGCLQDVGKGREQERKLCTSRSTNAEPGFAWMPRRARPEEHIYRVASLAKDNQPWPSACALHLGFGFLRRSTSCIPAVVHPSGRAESIGHYSRVPQTNAFA